MLVLLALLMPYSTDALGCASYRNRDRCTQKLARAGLPALPIVTLSLNADDPEVRWRSWALRDRILRRTCSNLDKVLRQLIYQELSGEHVWCTPAEAHYWTQPENRARFHYLACYVFDDYYVVHPPWEVLGCGLNREEQTAAYVNYVRSRIIGRPIHRAVSWRACITPVESAALPPYAEPPR
jgi:hypothetical protein